MHGYLRHSITEGTGHCLQGDKGGFGGLNSSTVLESYRLLGNLRKQETRGLER